MPRRVIGITLGDSAGIGPEIVRVAIDGGKLDADFDYRVIGDASGATPGQPTPASAKAALDALEESARLALAGEICAVVTGPVSKARMHEVGFAFPGQTEFFADRWRTPNHAMCLTGGSLTVALVTAHVPLKDVRLSAPEIMRVGELLADFLTLRLGRTVA